MSFAVTGLANCSCILLQVAATSCLSLSQSHDQNVIVVNGSSLILLTKSGHQNEVKHGQFTFLMKCMFCVQYLWMMICKVLCACTISFLMNLQSNVHALLHSSI